MTALADAYARAKRHTRAEKRKIKKSRPALAPKPEPDSFYRETLALAHEIENPIRHPDPDKGMDEPFAHQPRPNLALTIPSRDPHRPKAFAKTEPYDPSYSDLAVASQRRAIKKFGRAPEAKFVSPSRPNLEARKKAAAALQRIVDAEDQRRARPFGLHLMLAQVIAHEEGVAVREYLRGCRKALPQVRAWRA
jgi:hypothetical protein